LLKSARDKVDGVNEHETAKFVGLQKRKFVSTWAYPVTPLQVDLEERCALIKLAGYGNLNKLEFMYWLYQVK
jgi:hypothetical protein